MFNIPGKICHKQMIQHYTAGALVIRIHTCNCRFDFWVRQFREACSDVRKADGFPKRTALSTNLCHRMVTVVHMQ